MKKMNIINSIMHDYILLSCLLITIFTLTFTGIIFYWDEFAIFPKLVILPMSFAILGVSRYLVLKSYFLKGIIIRGIIVDIWFILDRGRITYQYKVDGQTYIKGISVMKTKKTRRLNKGTPVDLLVRPGSFKMAIIQDLYS